MRLLFFGGVEAIPIGPNKPRKKIGKTQAIQDDVMEPTFRLGLIVAGDVSKYSLE